jgi:putative membrane protein
MSSSINNPVSRRSGKFSLTLLATAASVFALTALPAAAQGTGGGSSSSSGASGSGGRSASAGGQSSVARADSKMMHELAETNNAEIETGKLVLEKSQNDQVKKYAQQMIDDHTSAQQELQTLAQSKGVKLPEGADAKHKTMATAMRALNGSTFDAQYIKRGGVDDHQNAVKLLEKTQKDAKDPELKAMATKMLPKVRHHLEMAQQMNTAMAKK